MSTAATGNATEAAVLKALIDRGLDVLVPFGGGQPFDLVVHLDGARFIRIQCKTARRRGGAMLFNSRTTDHGRGRLPYDGLADAFGVYAPWIDAVYLLPVSEVTAYVLTLRLDPTKNNQRVGVRFAGDYLLANWSDERLRSIVPAPLAVCP
jgi:hypothetical protein